MQEIDFSKYEQRQGQTARFLASEKERADMPLYQKAGIAAVVTAGLLTAGHRTGALRKVSRFLNVEAKVTRQAFQEVLQEEGKLFKNMNLDRAKNFKNRFAQKHQSLLKARREEVKDVLGRTTDMERLLKQRKDFIGRQLDDRNFQGVIPTYVEEGIRFDLIMKELRESDQLRGKKSLADSIETALGKGGIADLNFRDDSHINYLLKNQGIESQDITELVNSVRKKYQAAPGQIISSNHFTPRGSSDSIETGAKDWLEGIQAKLNETINEEMSRINLKNGKIKEIIVGHKQATVDDILALNKAGKVNLSDEIKEQVLELKAKNKSFGEAIWDENIYVKTKDGVASEIFDYEGLADFKQAHLDWVSNTLPGGLTKMREFFTAKSIRKQTPFRVMNRGTIQPSINAHQGLSPDAVSTKEFLFINGDVYNLFDDVAINSANPLKKLNKRKMYLHTSRYGSFAKIQRHVAGIMTDGQKTTIFGNKKDRNWFEKLFDLRSQSRDSPWSASKSIFTKWWNKDWERNRVTQSLRHGIQTKKEYFDLQRYMNKHTQGFNQRTFHHLIDELPSGTGESNIKQFVKKNKINFSRDEDVIKLFEFMGSQATKTEKPQLYQMYQQYKRSPEDFLLKSMPIGETNPIIGGIIRKKTGIDTIKQQLSIDIVDEIVNRGSSSWSGGARVNDQKQRLTNFLNQIDDLDKSGKILSGDKTNVEWIVNHYIFQDAGKQRIYEADVPFEQLNNWFMGSDKTSRRFQKSMHSMSKKVNPWYETMADIKPINRVEDELIAINRAFDSHTLGGRAKEFITQFPDKAKQMNPFTGRKNMEDFTTLSMFNYFLPHRLQDAAGSLFLGLSDSSMSSAGHIWTSLMLKRVLPAFALVEGYEYLDYKTGEYTGASINQRIQNNIAKRRLQEAQAREDLGTIEELRRARMLKPGLEHFDAYPSLNLPSIGEVGVGKAINRILGTVTGQTALTNDAMTYEETYEDIMYGTDEVRKGRWWAFGSKTPYRGDQITHFAPNAYRRAHSNWKYTDTLYGENGERWQNSKMPTFENPLGALGYVVGTADPYWFEKKHYYDRPYLLTGELFNRNTPFIGDVGNATIGKLIKPVREMHEEYWGDPVLVQQEMDRQTARHRETVLTRISPSGRINFEVPATPTDYGASGQYVVARLYNQEKKKFTGDEIVTDISSGASVYIPSRLEGEYVDYGQAFQAATFQREDEPTIRTRPRDIHNVEYAYHLQRDNEKLQNLKDPRSFGYRMQELIQNWAEPQGIYNWLIMDEILGIDPYTGTAVIERADGAYNASSRYWDTQLGSLVGSISEIGRRFIRRDSGMIDQYNPIRNTMPDWMPGSDYYINFKLGDPYSKIPYGEYRLPGAAYESLNQLHPDEFGRYGAFDKFKILADVAPWSDEYKFWRDYVTENIEDEQLRRQAAQIKRQVSRRKDKFDFQEYRFKNAKLEHVNVTVDRFLDDHTFLTKEFGDTPIRLAGIDVRKSAPGVLQEHFQEGDQIRIGVDHDPTKRISNDTYRTMRAVVFEKNRSLNKQLIESGAMKESETDFSPTGVWARFSPSEIRKGSRWESIAHHESALNTKFLKVRTAVEEYERDQMYLKSWATWDNFAIDDYLKPAVDRMIGRDSTVGAITSGFMIGGFIGRLVLGGGKNMRVAMGVGAAIGLVGNLYGKTYKKRTGDRWIPERRRIEHDINEYFDVLQYMKYSGLYEQKKEELLHQGYNVEALFDEVDRRSEETKNQRRELEARRRELFIQQPEGWQEERRQINQQLSSLQDDWMEVEIPAPVMEAMKYKEKRDTTLFAINPFDDRMKVMQAMPYKDRPFFASFADARLEDQEKILELVPENQRRIYKALWGRGLKEQKPLEYYANKYYIPDPHWEGWKPEFNLEEIKLKVVQEKGLDLGDFGFWHDDVMASRFVPSINEQNSPYVENNFKGYKDLERNIRAIMQGQGLQNIQVSVMPSSSSSTNVHLRYQQDRSKEIEEHLRYNMSQYV